jgi:ATP-grasp domain-containing protein
MTLALDPALVEPELPKTKPIPDSDDGIRLTSSGPSTVLFVDNRNWGCFFQLESGLRRSGFRTVRVTTGEVSRTASALCFDRTVRLDSADELVRLPELLAGENIIDVQVVESLAVATFGALATMPESPHRAAWARRRAAVDKLYVSDILHRRGLHTPETVPAYLTSAEYVADVLGLPVVHKPRRGAGGSEVAIVRTMMDLREILASESSTEDYFFERYVEGDQLQFSGVIAKGRALLSATYRTVERRCDMGPASAIKCIDDLPLELTGELVARTLGIEGMINVNVIRDSEGRDWVHDVNPRVWGSCLAFRMASLNFHQAYVAYLQGTAPAAVSCRPMAGSELTVFPAAVEGSAMSGANGFALVPFAKGVWPYLRWLGPRYAAYESVRHLRRMAYGMFRSGTAEATHAGPAPVVPLSVHEAPVMEEGLLAS